MLGQCGMYVACAALMPKMLELNAWVQGYEIDVIHIQIP